MCETKTKDNVFVQVGVAVQYRVVSDKSYDAYYRLANPRGQIESYVFDVVRSTVPKMDLDDAFESKDTIAEAVLNQLKDVMDDYGYEIHECLVTDLSPDSKVKASMNEINASKRLKEAATHKAEADKVRLIKGAEADAEAKYLSGVGVARQRKAIAEGLQASVEEFAGEISGTTPKDVMDILLLTQYFDVLDRKAIAQGLQTSVEEFAGEISGTTPKDVMDILLLTQYFDVLDTVGANSLILEHDPQVVGALQNQLRMVGA
eukprot:CAMPEP_0194392712 /NCGR_PEP_ID=MMETSP0174-20130528/122895_1 /TAXON_ID=216777 /ORGANISM="Proboscia alata, Strain PI-D3" /LENGTH=260 /DNA_ID=CAMNT_0039188315 /DNA_START=225 /DNA_END=1007 /DNA_ORIENTATION=-